MPRRGRLAASGIAWHVIQRGNNRSACFFSQDDYQSETYALTCYRCIELNPVRAGMVCAPADYRWSSYHHNATGKVDPVLTPHPNYLALATQAEVRLSSYRALFATALDLATLNRIRGATNGCFALGNARFEAQIAATLSRRVTPGKSGRPKKVMGDSD